MSHRSDHRKHVSGSSRYESSRRSRRSRSRDRGRSRERGEAEVRGHRPGDSERQRQRRTGEGRQRPAEKGVRREERTGRGSEGRTHKAVHVSAAGHAAASSSSSAPSAASSCSNRMEFHQEANREEETRISSLVSGNDAECITHRLTIGTSLLPAPLTSQSSQSSQSTQSSQSSPDPQSLFDKRQAQEQKRKLLWAADAVPSKASVWHALKFANDSKTDKFRKLMGIKETASPPHVAQEGTDEAAGLQKRQEEIFRNLDKQYSVARTVTHSQRGTGLGFGS